MTEQASMKLIPAVLCGGAGTRLWPVSRAARPKQVHALVGERSMLGETVARAAEVPGVDPHDVVLIAGESLAEAARTEATAGGAPDALIVLEPTGRNTAPAAALACLAALDRTGGADALVLLAPSDHHIAEPANFAAAVAKGAKLAADGWIVTFGINPTFANTGFGYISRGAALGDGYRVEKFHEKPPLAEAERMLAAGGYYWNAGIFLFGARRMMEELARHEPKALAAAEAAWAKGARTGETQRLDADAWINAPSISLDYAVAERTDRAAIVPVSMGWDDVGSWAALHELGAKDAHGNHLRGDVAIADTRNSYVRAESRLVAVVGMDDVIVVETADAVLVIPRAKAQDVKSIVDALKAGKRSDLL